MEKFMKRVKRFSQELPIELMEGIELLQEQWQRNSLSIRLFFMMCLNLVIAPAVYASAGAAITRQTAWSIGLVHKGVTLCEMDTDAILERQPQLVLVDELAHTNVPGSQREKRYQDVEVILEAGIDVYSTLNIQHLESLNGLVAKITGVVVRERIPDRILDEATEVVVIDVTPETLQERLIEGKIYAPEKIEQSLQNFFQKRHLVALRELALREVADNIEEAAETSTPTGQFCCVHERVLVCLSTYPNSVQLLRRGARLATVMRARLYALFVENPEHFLTRDESLHIETCEHFCRDFGGEFIRVKSANVAEAIAQSARQYHITQVILGQSHKSRWEILWKGSLVQKLVRYLKDVDLHIIATEKNSSQLLRQGKLFKVYPVWKKF